jgi:5'-nucleotidase (lipoprotein e(P4) family)
MKKILVILVAVALVSCSTQKTNFDQSNRLTGLLAYLWHQTSAEYVALSFQAYNLAKLRVEKDLEDKHNRKRAVVFDIDETVLDNSYSGAYEVKYNIPWSKDNFNEWVKKRKATAIPGAVSFIDFLIKNRVEPIFVSNRKNNQFEDTYENLVSVGIKVKKENLLLMGDDWGKEERRLKVLRDYDIVLLVGDNLSDFHKMFDKIDAKKRVDLVNENRQLFGDKFIVLPNPLYGDWERSLPRLDDLTNHLKIVE